MHEEPRLDRLAIAAIATVIIGVSLIYLFQAEQTYVHIDAIAHVNKARGLWDTTHPGFKQLGSIWLPLPHVVFAPLTLSDWLWSTGLAGSLVSAVCFVGCAVFLYSAAFMWTTSRGAGWLAFLFFALNPRMVYLFTTPMTEPLMAFCAAGLLYFLIHWIRSESWTSFWMASLFVFAGTLTRYEGWAIAAIAVPLACVTARSRRFLVTTLFAGAAALGPVLWLIQNKVYYGNPFNFEVGPGSAYDYVRDYFLRTGLKSPTEGSVARSLSTYWTDVAYCFHSGVVWLAVGGGLMVWLIWRGGRWRTSAVVLAMAIAPFLFYTYSLYTNNVVITMPGLIENDPTSIYNVRYGAVMAATIPVLAGFAGATIFQLAERRRAVALGLILVSFLPSPIPEESEESPAAQLTTNLFYAESVRNQGFWMPPFVDVALKLHEDMTSLHDDSSQVLTNSRSVHPLVWAASIHMKRFVDDSDDERWAKNLVTIDPSIRWVVTEEGDQLWQTQGPTLEANWTSVAAAKLASNPVVHLYRRREPEHP